MDLTRFSGIYKEFKSQVAFTLFLIWILAIWHFLTLNSILYPLFSVLLMTALDVFYTRLRYRKWYWPSASFVTGFLIGLIIDPKEPVWVLTIAVMAAFLSKQFIGVGLRQNIFNPAAFGLMTVSSIFGTTVAWWAISWGKLPLLILIPAMIWILYRMKRLWLPGTFLAVYSLFLIIKFSLAAALNSLLDGTFLMFALVMLPEPITSPVVGKYKYFFGAGVAILAIFIAQTRLLAEVFLPALLIADLSGFLIRKFRKGVLKSPQA